jgi:hypothetical protein
MKEIMSEEDYNYWLNEIAKQVNMIEKITNCIKKGGRAYPYFIQLDSFITGTRTRLSEEGYPPLTTKVEPLGSSMWLVGTSLQDVFFYVAVDKEREGKSENITESGEDQC